LFFSQKTQGQRLGFYDSDSVLLKMPQYAEAQKQLADFSLKVEEELRKEQEKINLFRKKLIQTKPIVSEEEYQAALDNILRMELALDKQHENLFGFKGELFQKKMTLRNTYESVLKAGVEKVCKKQKLNFLIDRSSDLLVIYGEPAFNYTQHILTALGFKKVTPKKKKTDKKTDAAPLANEKNIFYLHFLRLRNMRTRPWAACWLH